MSHDRKQKKVTVISGFYQRPFAFATLRRKVFHRSLDEVHPGSQWIHSLVVGTLAQKNKQEITNVIDSTMAKVN